MGVDLVFISRVATILSLPIVLYTFFPLSISITCLSLLKFLATLTIIQYSLHQAFYPPTWFHTAAYRDEPPQPDDRWQRQED